MEKVEASSSSSSKTPVLDSLKEDVRPAVKKPETDMRRFLCKTLVSRVSLGPLPRRIKTMSAPKLVGLVSGKMREQVEEETHSGASL